MVSNDNLNTCNPRPGIALPQVPISALISFENQKNLHLCLRSLQLNHFTNECKKKIGLIHRIVALIDGE